MEFIKRLFENKKNLAIVGIIVAAIALPIIISQVLRQQDTRQGATGAPSVNLNFSPHDKNLAVNETFTFSLNLNAPQNNIGGMHFSITYDPTLLDITDITQPTDLKILQKKNESGIFEVTLINPNNTPVTGNGLVVLTFQGKAKKNGVATVKMNNDAQITSGGFDTNTPIDLPDNIFAIYTIGSIVSPTADICVAPTGLWPNGCSCTRDDQCANRKCSPTGPNGTGFCTDYLSPTPSVTVVPTDIPLPSVTPIPTVPTATLTPYPTATSVPTAVPTSVPTLTSFPTATTTPGDTTVAFATLLPGIGLNTSLGLNPNPVHQQLSGTVKILNGQGDTVKEVRTLFTYSPQLGLYKTIASLGPSFPSGSYTLKYNIDRTLYKFIPTVITISTGNPTTIVTVATLISGDLNGDNVLTIQDYNNFLACFKNFDSCSSSELKDVADLNQDGNVEGDLKDNNIIQYGFANQSGD